MRHGSSEGRKPMRRNNITVEPGCSVGSTSAVFQRSVQHISDMHSKLARRRLRIGKEKKKKLRVDQSEEENQLISGATSPSPGISVDSDTLSCHSRVFNFKREGFCLPAFTTAGNAAMNATVTAQYCLLFSDWR